MPKLRAAISSVLSAISIRPKREYFKLRTMKMMSAVMPSTM